MKKIEPGPRRPPAPATQAVSQPGAAVQALAAAMPCNAGLLWG